MQDYGGDYGAVPDYVVRWSGASAHCTGSAAPGCLAQAFGRYQGTTGYRSSFKHYLRDDAAGDGLKIAYKPPGIPEQAGLSAPPPDVGSPAAKIYPAPR